MWCDSGGTAICVVVVGSKCYSLIVDDDLAYASPVNAVLRAKVRVAICVLASIPRKVCS